MRVSQTAAIVAIVFACSTIVAAATYGGGSGTAEEPYEIWTPQQMNTIGANPGDWDKHFKLMASIDMSIYTGTQYNIIGIYNTRTHTEEPFTGTFDGNNHTIANLTYTTTEDIPYIGLFGLIEDATIQNLGLEDVLVSSSDDSFADIGGLVGCSHWGGSLVNCYVTGSISQTSSYGSAGGLIGNNIRGSITSCYANVSVSVTGFYGSVGGLVGDNFMGTLNACFSTGSVSGDSCVGGLAGYNYMGTLTSCYSTCLVTGTGNYVGGLIGYNSGYGTLTACYATGSISGDAYVGGVAGGSGGFLIACYATGSVSGNSHVGGLTGGFATSLNSCFWNIQTSGQAGSSVGKGLTTEQMKTMSIYQNAGWADTDWVMVDGEDYPHLSWENTGGVPIPFPQAIPLVGNGTEDEPYLISTPQEFALLSWYSGVLDKHIRLAANLDLSGLSLWPIGDLGCFRGVFDGNSHTISNAVIEQPGSDHVGLFGLVGFDGSIHDLIVENVNITGCNWVGGLAGKSSVGTLSGCHVTGSVSGSYSVGGLLGENGPGTLIGCSSAATVNGTKRVGGLTGNSWGSPITGCFATGLVAGTDYVGGLVGWHSSYLADCYATGSVNGTTFVGGLVGYNERSGISGGLIGKKWGHLRHCYATGSVSGTTHVGGLAGDNQNGYISGCFWDIQTSGQTASDGGSGKTTEEMMTQSTFTDFAFPEVGWEFASAQSIGVWIMPDDSYPLLAWQFYTPTPIPDVKGLSAEEALSALMAADFDVYGTRVIYDESVPAGLVSGTTPPSGMTAYPGLTQIILLVAKDIHYSGGDGSIGRPYQISSVDDWYELGVTPDDWDKHFKLMADLDMSMYLGRQYDVIGYVNFFTEKEYPFTGTFDGNGHVIHNLTYIRTASVDCVGLFGYTYDAVIMNLGLENVSILSSGNYVGGLTGINVYSSIINCYVSGSVSGTSAIGGLMGENWNGMISDCYATGSVSGTGGFIGGLVGINGGTLDACYATSSVNGTGEDVGGLVGQVYEGTLTACFWDTEMSRQSSGVGEGSPDGVTGKTTGEMKTLATFAGWDFVNTWAICEGTNYPRLRWQIAAADWVCPDGVGVMDFAHLAGWWLANGCAAQGNCAGVDLDRSGDVGMADLLMLAEQWMR